MKMSKGLAGRLGKVKGGGGVAMGGGVTKIQGDARMKIIQASRSKTVDARYYPLKRDRTCENRTF